MPKIHRFARLLSPLFWVLFAAMGSACAEDAVTVHLLEPTGKRATRERFWIDWSNEWRGIVTTREATPEQAAKLVELFRGALLKREAEHRCGHDPIYGIVAKSADGKVLKTSLCFTCLTWVKPGKRLLIAGGAGAENDLCKALREVIELPPELLEGERK